jgi:hypothetical protein
VTTVPVRSPVTKPLLRAGTSKPVPPDPRAYDTFRVTQQFGSLDGFFPGQVHGAVDIGNFRCGDPVVAPISGMLTRVRDDATASGAATDALGVRILSTVAPAVSFELWHLNGYAGPSSGFVAAGTQVGVVGRTGLGNVCHLHIECKFSGRKVDPEPYLFGTPLVVGEEDDMALPTEAGYFVEGTVGGPGVNLRVKAETTEGARLTTGETPLKVLGIRRNGPSYTISVNNVPKTDNDWYVVATSDGETWEVAKLLVYAIKPTPYLFSQVPLPAADCSAQEAAIVQLKTKIARANTANNGAMQAQTAVKVALG